MNLRQKRMLMTGGCADRFNLRPPGADAKRNVKMQDLTLYYLLKKLEFA